jgi:hypothetical protein
VRCTQLGGVVLRVPYGVTYCTLRWIRIGMPAPWPAPLSRTAVPYCSITLRYTVLDFYGSTYAALPFTPLCRLHHFSVPFLILLRPAHSVSPPTRTKMARTECATRDGSGQTSGELRSRLSQDPGDHTPQRRKQGKIKTTKIIMSSSWKTGEFEFCGRAWRCSWPPMLFSHASLARCA